MVGPLDYFADDRSGELATLVVNYDQRNHNTPSTSLGVSYDGPSSDGAVFLPIYNLGGVSSHVLNSLFERLYGIQLQGDFQPNFLWLPFNLRAYRAAHLPMADAFYRRHHVSLDSVLSAVAALCIWAAKRWLIGGIDQFIHLWQRAYSGPHTRDNLIDAVKTLWPEACTTLGCPDISDRLEAAEEGIAFWSLEQQQRDHIDTVYSGPHQVILPAGKSDLFVDYAWIHRRTFDLFVGVSISDQNFKGKALEAAVRNQQSALPSCELIGDDGTRKQVDYAVWVGSDMLLVVECKAIARSIAFDRGRPDAITYRKERVVIEGLRQVDEKALWLSAHPKGRNYDISGCSKLLPLVVSPFVNSFIPEILSIG